MRNKLKEIANKSQVIGQFFPSLYIDTCIIINNNSSSIQCSTTGSASLSAVEFMDDGSPVRVTIDIDKDEGTAYFDFTGTGPQVLYNVVLKECLLCRYLVTLMHQEPSLLQQFSTP